jgi:hypothetical protein
MHPDTHKDVAGFEIAVDEVARMYVLQARDLATVHQSAGCETRNQINSPIGWPAVE